MTAPTLPGYVIEATLGRGAMGTVHLARRADWAGRVVAVKRVPHAGAGLARTLRHEAEVLAALDHPHIVRVLDLVPDGDGVAIAMQYAAGGSLPDLLRRRGRLAPGEVVAVAAPVADALASAHRRGLLHCDVKPANVLFTSDGEPLLSDFGLARRMGPPGVPGTRAGTGPVAGTAEYLDPAVAAGAPADRRSDVYGLGIVCYELLAGRPPFTGATPAAAVDAALAGEPVPLRVAADGTPLALAHVVERAMARHPADRFADAAAFAAALRAAVPPSPVIMTSAPPGRPGATAAPCDEVSSRPAGPMPPDSDRVAPGVGRPTRTFGPRPPRGVGTPSSTAGARPRRRMLLAAGVTGAAVVLATGGAALVPQPDRPRTSPPATGPAAAPAAAPTARSCPAPSSLRRADVDGDGCPSAVSWKDNVAEVEGRRYELGRPGDALLVGDWDCNGTDTPALYRPSTGEAFLFDRWAGTGPGLAPGAGDRLPAGGVPSVAPGTDGCDRMTVRARD